MRTIALFLVAFALAFFVFKMRGQKTADCIHKGLIAGIVASLAGFAAATAFSYL